MNVPRIERNIVRLGVANVFGAVWRAGALAGRGAGAFCAAAQAASFCAATGCIVLIGATVLCNFPLRGGSADPPSVFRWDAVHYDRIARTGYAYDETARSIVAFFPFYPLSARFVAWATGIDLQSAMLWAANAFLLGAFVLWSAYVRRRCGCAGATPGACLPATVGQRSNLPPERCSTFPTIMGYSLLAFGLFPTSFFFRMPYSESCFLFFAILAMLGMECRWPLLPVAVIVGLATATRPVAVALLAVFCLHVWRGSVNWRAASLKLVLFAPLAAWGLVAFMGYQYAAFGHPLAFAKTQEHWTARGDVSTSDKALALLSYEPIWSVYDVESLAYWRRLDPQSPGVVNLPFANPIYFLLAIVLVVVGRWKGWLNGGETFLGALLIFIPYVTRSYEMCMQSQGRFMAAVFPIYLVLGHILSRIPGPFAAMILCFLALLLAAYSAHFAAGYPLI
jgi:hypothetical protein